MAYPIVDAPYGLKPTDLIGGQVFAGSTRNLPIQYGYATNIGYGDIVKLVRGFVNISAATTAFTGDATVGVFLGCSYTNPITKQKFFSQYWPAGTLAGDAVAIVCDDPDTIFKVAVCSAGTTMAGIGLPFIGQNAGLIQNAMNPNTGNSSVALLAQAAVAANAGFPARIVDIVRDTAIFTSAVGSSATTTITLTGSGLPNAIPLGCDVAYIAPNGQLVETGSFVAAAAAAGATSVTLNATIAVPGGIVAIPAASTIVFTQYQEALVKLNFGMHEYYAAAAV